MIHFIMGLERNKTPNAMWVLAGVSEYLQALTYMQSMDISKLINISEPELKLYLAFQ